MFFYLAMTSIDEIIDRLNREYDQQLKEKTNINMNFTRTDGFFFEDATQETNCLFFERTGQDVSNNFLGFSISLIIMLLVAAMDFDFIKLNAFDISMFIGSMFFLLVTIYLTFSDKSNLSLKSAFYYCSLLLSSLGIGFHIHQASLYLKKTYGKMTKPIDEHLKQMKKFAENIKNAFQNTIQNRITPDQLCGILTTSFTGIYSSLFVITKQKLSPAVIDTIDKFVLENPNITFVNQFYEIKQKSSLSKKEIIEIFFLDKYGIQKICAFREYFEEISGLNKDPTKQIQSAELWFNITMILTNTTIMLILFSYNHWVHKMLTLSCIAIIALILVFKMNNGGLAIIIFCIPLLVTYFVLLVDRFKINEEFFETEQDDLAS